ncbi:glycosyltransferase family 2 protein [Saccharothrix obliqua]|uniref:glycosyltransferase family 2 protein n=1 Tax=Saccharothrix obliqua TaxID=2861747 RepID=UPI001C5F8FA5|nr:glycosyltransferase [Saccharothrix obliqua]MBW4717134.1 glycosyltransferase [Saccharothrix obliqua]
MVAQTTVVIATRDRADELVHTLERLRELSVPVVVVDNGSSDDTVARVRRDFPWVDVIELKHNVGASARNHGVRRARTRYVAFSDDDSWWAPDALVKAEALFRRYPRLGLVAARIVVEPEGRVDPVCAEMAFSPLGRADDLPGPSVLGFVCCASVVRRGAFLRVGGFNPVLFFPGEERLFSWDLTAAGWACCYVDDVVAHHRPSKVRGPSAVRRRAELRNDLLTTWLRRPPGVALAEAVALGRRGVGDEDARAALAGALRKLPAVVGQRRRLPAEVERQVALLDRSARVVSPAR